MYRRHTPIYQAFTLIELSLALVIIGLIVGGILVGRDMIKAAELRSVLSELESFKTATTTFRLKYNCMAGDCINATQFFGTAAVCPGDGDNPRTTTTCNGNGDSIIRNNAASSVYQNEAYGYWQHLALAGLIEGTYTGVTANTALHSSYDMTIGNNVPSGAVPTSSWSVYNAGSFDVSSSAFSEGFYGNAYFFAAETDGIYYPNNLILTPISAYNIDDKIDDGFPLMGTVRTGENNPNANNLCFVTDAGAAIAASTTLSRAVSTIVYNKTRTNISCSLIFLNVF